MIRDAVIHLIGEQPLLADLPVLPAGGDAALVCTNLRTMNRTRPIFVDRSESTFVFPYTQVRFVEVPREELAVADQPPALPAVVEEPDELELDEELLRRVREL